MVFLSFCLLVVSFSGVDILFGSGVECVRLVFRFVTKDGDSNISSGCVVDSGLVSGIIVISSALLSCCKVLLRSMLLLYLYVGVVVVVVVIAEGSFHC